MLEGLACLIFINFFGLIISIRGLLTQITVLLKLGPIVSTTFVVDKKGNRPATSSIKGRFIVR